MQAQYESGTRAWRSPAKVLQLAPAFALNAMIPAFPAGEALARVPLVASLVVFGLHFACFVAASVALRRSGDPSGRAYRLFNALDSGLWIVGAATLVGLSGSSASIYWTHCGLVVVLGFPNIPSHRRLRWLLGIGTMVAASLLLAGGSVSDAIFATMVGATLVLFQTLTMQVAPRAVRAQARAELLSERASELLVRLERERIKRELHDNIGAELTALLWNAQRLGDEQTETIAPLVEQIRRSMGELRVVMHSVAPEPMAPKRLSIELERVLDRLSGSGVAMDVTMTPNGHDGAALPGETCLALIRAAQECARNSVRHGGATRVRVDVTLGDDIVLTIRDDGDAPTTLVPGEGLRGLERRFRELGGTFAWRRDGDGGLLVEASAPAF